MLKMNFKIDNKTIHNNCDNGKGKCCMLCDYISDDVNKKWKACSESCIKQKDITEFSCTKCGHKPEYIK